MARISVVTVHPQPGRVSRRDPALGAEPDYPDLEYSWWTADRPTKRPPSSSDTETPCALPERTRRRAGRRVNKALPSPPSASWPGSTATTATRGRPLARRPLLRCHGADMVGRCARSFGTRRTKAAAVQTALARGRAVALPRVACWTSEGSWTKGEFLLSARGVLDPRDLAGRRRMVAKDLYYSMDYELWLVWRGAGRGSSTCRTPWPSIAARGTEDMERTRRTSRR